jgi:hypothetical protein
MDIKSKTTNELKIMLKQFSNVSMGVRDLILKHAIEDELQWRKNNV